MAGRLDLEVQKLAIQLIRQLAAVKKMSAIKVFIGSAKETKPIVLMESPKSFIDLSIWHFLKLDVEAAIAKGGTLHDLLNSKRPKRPRPPTFEMEPLDVETLDDAMSTIEIVLPQSK